jgi:hypothetical protein
MVSGMMSKIESAKRYYKANKYSILSQKAKHKLLEEVFSKIVNNYQRGSTASGWYDVIVKVGYDYGIKVHKLYIKEIDLK